MEVYRDPRGEKPSPAEVAPEVLKEFDAAKFLGIGHRTLWGLRKAGKGPRYFRCGREIRYRRQWLLEWMEQGGTK